MKNVTANHSLPPLSSALDLSLLVETPEKRSGDFPLFGLAYAGLWSFYRSKHGEVGLQSEQERPWEEEIEEIEEIAQIV